MITLITGGACSGKSDFAEQQAAKSRLEVVYVATAQAGDAEMRSRIQQHRERRPTSWSTVEEPLHLAQTLSTYAAKNRCIVVDCLTLWLTNLILRDNDMCDEATQILVGPTLLEESTALLNALPTLNGNIIIVTNEIGMGLVPLGALSRFFVDKAGRLNQAVAQLSDRLCWMVAGCPVWVKGDSPC